MVSPVRVNLTVALEVSPEPLNVTVRLDAPAPKLLLSVMPISVGLAGNASIPSLPPTLATVAGLGVGIPLGNAGQPTQAALNLHAWISREFRSDFNYFAPGDTAHAHPLQASHWAFIFGPSISIGNVGTVL